MTSTDLMIFSANYILLLVVACGFFLVIFASLFRILPVWSFLTIIARHILIYALFVSVRGITLYDTVQWQRKAYQARY